jgi:hypothetical protein
MKIINTVLRIILALLLLMPIAGALGFLPPPTEEMYTPEGWEFMSALMNSGYIMPIFAFVSFVCVILLFTGYSALAAVLLAPLTVNIIAFHWFLDFSPISAASIPAYLLLLLNLYFLWQNRSKYQALFSR